MKQIIFNAFGLADTNDKNFKKLIEIDLVYPKKSADEGDMDPEWLNGRIDELYVNPVRNYKKMGQGSGQGSIASIFENMKFGQGDDDDEEESGFTKKAKLVKPTTETIVDILCDKKFDRDSKLVELNILLNSLFPRLEGDNCKNSLTQSVS